MIYYKIYSNKLDKYSSGGSTPRFTKTGKTWTQRGHLSNHFTQLDARGKKSYVDNDCVIISYETRELSRVPAKDGINAAEVRADMRRELEIEQQKALRELVELAELQRLLNKYKDQYHT